MKKLIRGLFLFAKRVRNSPSVVRFRFRSKAKLLRFEDWIFDRNKEDGLPVPPPLLRFRVHGALEAPGFLAIGKICANNIQSLLGTIGKDVYSFNNILDFGCGSGRVIRYFASHPPTCHFTGTDIDAEMINWAKKNLPIADFDQNGPYPPLKYKDGSFDLIYGISVFTHLNEEMQFMWLKELKRVSAKNGVLVLTVGGAKSRTTWDFPEQDKKRLEEEGIIFYITQTGKSKLDGLPDFYQHTVHTKEYVMREWGKFFRVANYVEAGINNHQDAIVLINDL